MSGAEDKREFMPIDELFGNAVELRVTMQSKHISQAAEKEYIEAYKYLLEEDQIPLPHDETEAKKEAEVMKDFTDQYIYRRGFHDGIFMVMRILNTCGTKLQGAEHPQGLLIPGQAAFATPGVTKEAS